MTCLDLIKNKTNPYEVTGRILQVKVLLIKKKFVYLDLGLKNIIKYPRRGLKHVEQGQSFYTIFYNTNISQNKKGLQLFYSWNHILLNKNLSGRLLNRIKGGYSVGIGGIVTFLPNSKFKKKKEKKKVRFGEVIDLKVLNINHRLKNVVVSRR